MIIVFSSNEQGGILQYAVTAASTLLKLGEEVLCYFPKCAKVTLPDTISPLVIWYHKEKCINPFNKAAKSVSKDILQRHPSLVWYVDNATFTSQVGYLLAGKVKQAIIMHDVIRHSTNNITVRNFIKRLIEKRTSELCNRHIDWIITCSPSSKDDYCRFYPSQKNKVYMLPLGAHMPKGETACPPETKDITDFNLFFGRIDRYKGIDILLRTYSMWNGHRKLIIAGSGQLQPQEKVMAESDPRVILVNRFIRDEEMPWLFCNAHVIILPYKDASQSGVLPIAYMCGKPIVCSDVIGISQFVEEGKTGFVCSTEKEYLDAYDSLENPTVLRHMEENSRQYYKDHLEWRNNVKHMIQAFKQSRITIESI